MTLTIEKINQMDTAAELIESTKLIRAESTHYYHNNRGVIDKTFQDYRLLETIAYKRAVEIAITPEELEACALSIEEDSLEYPDPNEWADAIRIKAYGIEWYLEELDGFSVINELLNFMKEEECMTRRAV